MARVESYIENQEFHHRQETYQDEIERLLRKYNLDPEESGIWD